jgi:CubicO group peptidase (beta-lactamase class C family)
VGALGAVLVLAASAAGQQVPRALVGLDAYVTQALKDWDVPGLAIAVVQGDSVVYAKGFGVRALGRSEPVDARTMFAIGSCTKAFTGVTTAMLVDEQKVRWSDPVTAYLRGFELYDPYVTRELRVQDILSHRSGLARGDLVWYGSSYDRDEILRRVRYLRPSWSFRSQFGYQNIMFLAAGQIVARVAGKRWDDVVRERVFLPLGMTATNTSIAALKGLDDVAVPHARIEDTVRAIEWRNIDNIGPAGSINSNVLDMAKWVRFQLDSGKVNGKTLITASSFVETHTPHTIVPRTTQARALNPYTHFQTYGFGWFLQDYRGREVVQHGGNIDGMSALVGMMPEEKIGVVILTNMNGTVLPTAIMNVVFDRYLGMSKDWSADMLKVVKGLEAQQKATERKQEAGRVQGTKPSLALEKYAGTYSDSLYGTATVAMQAGHLVLSAGPTFVGDLEHWHYDVFRARWRDRQLGKSFVAFSLGVNGDVDGMKLDMGDGAIAEEVPSFRKTLSPADTVPKVEIAEAELRRFVGTWESKVPPLSLTVDLIGGTLKLTVPGQPVYTLVPVSRTRFRLTGPPEMPAGFFVQYQVDGGGGGGGGTVRGMTLEQPSPQPTMTFVKSAK